MNQEKSSARLLLSALQLTTARGKEIIVAAITSNVRRRLFGDHLIAEWKRAGLLFSSLVAGIFRTIKRTMIDRKVGTMPKQEMEAIDLKLRQSLGL